MAAVQGLPDYRFVLVQHPIANAGDEELRARAERALPGIVELLTRRTA